MRLCALFFVFVIVGSGCTGDDGPSKVDDVAEPQIAAAKVATLMPEPPPEPTPQPLPSPSPEKTFRIATYNINFGNPNLAAVIDACRQADADIVCFQETNNLSASALRQELGIRYRHILFNGTVRPYLAGGFGILSKLPITKQAFIPAAEGMFGICVAEVQMGDQPIQIINVHLQPVSVPRGNDANLAAVLTAFSKTEQIHAREIAHVLEQVRPDVPAIIVGDFNSLSGLHAPATLVERGFVDSFAAVNEDAELQPTWRWHTKFGDVSLRIDYVFHTPSLRTIDSRVIETEGSDHYLVVSKLATVPPGDRLAD